MNACFSFGRLCAVGRIMVMGLCVLWTELRWLVGPDRRFAYRLWLMNREHVRLTGELARMATLADPRREAIAADLSLLEEDIARLGTMREEAFRSAHSSLRIRFADDLATD